MEIPTEALIGFAILVGIGIPILHRLGLLAFGNGKTPEHNHHKFVQHDELEAHCTQQQKQYHQIIVRDIKLFDNKIEKKIDVLKTLHDEKLSQGEKHFDKIDQKLSDISSTLNGLRREINSQK